MAPLTNTDDAMSYKKYLTIIFFSVFSFIGCAEDFSNNPQENQPPNTFLSIFSENELNPSTSQLTLNWWGDDPDGVVVGYIYTFEEDAPNLQTWDFENPDPQWTFDSTKTQETFSLTVGGTDTVYTFRVKAIDDDHAADPDGATQSYPIVNTRPIVEFPVGVDVPETTFTVNTFNWNGTDLDGNDTIEKYQYVLDDTSDESAWIDLPGDETNITLRFEDGLTEGEHVFFLRAVDLAGAESDIIRMPQSEDDIWYVREPTSTFLILDDYNVADNTDSFYQSALRSLVGDVDVWDIKRNAGELAPASSITFRETLLLFDRIFWYADTGPNLEKAQVSIPAFLEAGGKILMTTSFREFSSNQGDPLDFSPVDSLGTRINRLLRDQLVQPTAAFSDLGFPELQVNTAIIPNVFPLVPKISSEVVYRLPESEDWSGTPPMGVINGSSTFVFFGLPLASLNGLNTTEQLIEKIFIEIF